MGRSARSTAAEARRARNPRRLTGRQRDEGAPCHGDTLLEAANA